MQNITYSGARRMLSRIVPVLLFAMFLLTCRKDESCRTADMDTNHSRYYVLDITAAGTIPGRTFIPMTIHQQTTDYSCGPSAVVTLLGYYGRTADEMQIASEMGTSTSCGTNPQQMADWLSVNGFEASWHENGTLEMLRASLEDKAPVLVEWSDWGGHWVLVVGYDTRNTETMADDVIIFADPYDRHDDNMDGLTWFNAERFFYMWYDALLFDRVMRRVYVRARPV
ncbi:MAG TPA: C39 family peptidase [Bacteroidales bacterium]|nr:C39 family peptidase [Bacteroidales bacterium]